MKKVMTVFGTRPEAIKMCPLVKELKKSVKINTVVCVTGQHDEMLKQVLDKFHVLPDYNLKVMRENQTLFDVTTNILNRIREVLLVEKPDLVLVHGDTTTTFAAALACFYLKIPVGHVEAGLRTGNIYSPFPEEYNRKAVSLISYLNFAPTNLAKENLIKENFKEDSIFVTGNTVIDALATTVVSDYNNEHLEWANGSKMILLTAHRRENYGKPMENMFKAVRRVIEDNSDVKVIFPAHLNPKIRQLANKFFGDVERIRVISPLDVFDFHNFMARAYLILTDSGGIQEEAPSLGIPVLVMRDTTERPEGVQAGTLKLIGTSEEAVYYYFNKLLKDKELYHKMKHAVNPYGDGKSSQRIVQIIEKRI